MDDCRECKQPLVEIENRGKRLRCCMTCNECHDNHGNLVRLSVEIWLHFRLCVAGDIDDADHLPSG